jgi:hypothetical protein
LVLPVLFWQGKPLDDGIGDKHDRITDLELNEPEEGFLIKALRENMCPNCVAEIVLVDSLIVSGNSRVYEEWHQVLETQPGNLGKTGRAKAGVNIPLIQ